MMLADRLYPETKDVKKLLEHMVALTRATTGVDFEVDLCPESHVGQVIVVVDGKRATASRKLKAGEIVAWFEGCTSGWLTSENFKNAKAQAAPVVARGKLDDASKHLTAEQLGVAAGDDRPVTRREFAKGVLVMCASVIVPVAVLIAACFGRDWLWGSGQ